MKIEETISIVLEQLYNIAENNPDRNDIANAVGEVTIEGVVYQIQVQLIQDKKIWIGENECRFTEVVKLHT